MIQKTDWNTEDGVFFFQRYPGQPGRCETLWSWQGGVEAAEKLLGKDDLFDPEDDDLRWMRWGVYPLVI